MKLWKSAYELPPTVDVSYLGFLCHHAGTGMVPVPADASHELLAFGSGGACITKVCDLAVSVVVDSLLTTERRAPYPKPSFDPYYTTALSIVV